MHLGVGWVSMVVMMVVHGGCVDGRVE
jgi:hypothetical protein